MLAKQIGQTVIWKHNTPAGTSEYTATSANSAIGRTEFDPVGADISLTAPPSPLPNEGDGDVGLTGGNCRAKLIDHRYCPIDLKPVLIGADY